jgi:RNA polymerase sigma-70 factor, ECF subfamily
MSEAAGDLAGFLRDRDEESFRRLYRRHTPRMTGLATRMLGGADDVADVVQEAWVRVVRDLERFEGRSRLDTWILGYVVRCCREAWRRRGRDQRRWAPLEPVEDRLEAAPDPAGRHRGLDLEAALRSLAPGYRCVLLLHDLYGLTHGEIAESLGVAEGTAKSQLARARRAARRALEPPRERVRTVGSEGGGG